MSASPAGRSVESSGRIVLPHVVTYTALLGLLGLVSVSRGSWGSQLEEMAAKKGALQLTGHSAFQLIQVSDTGTRRFERCRSAGRAAERLGLLEQRI